MSARHPRELLHVDVKKLRVHHRVTSHRVTGAANASTPTVAQFST